MGTNKRRQGKKRIRGYDVEDSECILYTCMKMSV